MLRIHDLAAGYSTERRGWLSVLDNLSLELSVGSVGAIIGPSGCGKSTLLKCIAGLHEPTAGRISFENRAPNELRSNHRVGYVFQNQIFLAWRTAIENVAVATDVANITDGRQRAALWLERLGLKDAKNAYPHELSGGMLARVALARALVLEPTILILDEAFSHLDEALRASLSELVRSLHEKLYMTTLFVSHDIAQATVVADRLFIMDDRPAEINTTINVDTQDRSYDSEAVASYTKQARDRLMRIA